MYCAHCGKALPDGSRFCSRCGAALPKSISNNRPTIMDEIKKVSFNLDEIKKAIPISGMLTPGNIVSIIGAVLMMYSVSLPVYTVGFSGQSYPLTQLGIASYLPVIVGIAGIVFIILGKDNLYGLTATVGVGTTIIMVVLTNIHLKDIKAAAGYYGIHEADVTIGTAIYVLIIATIIMFAGLIIREKMKGTDSN